MSWAGGPQVYDAGVEGRFEQGMLESPDVSRYGLGLGMADSIQGQGCA